MSPRMSQRLGRRSTAGNGVRLLVDNFEGINIEKGVLTRPENSFKRLDNFDLVKVGAIRKIKGNKRLTVDGGQADSAIVAMRDFQSVPSGPERLVVIAISGKLYISGLAADPISLINLAALTTVPLDTAPFVVSLPVRNSSNAFQQYIFVTLGDLGPPKKFDGVNTTRVGVLNPADMFSDPHEHSLVIPQLLYTDPALTAEIYQYTSPDPRQGIPVVQGKRYRYSWYNPTTRHDSSLAPLYVDPVSTYYGIPVPASGTSKPGGIVVTTPAAPYVMAVPLFFNAIPRTPSTAIVPPDVDGVYTHIRIWSTRDGAQEYYLVATIRNESGTIVSDDDGAVPVSGRRYGYPLIGDPVGAYLNYKPLYDGYGPIGDGIIPINGVYQNVFRHNEVTINLVVSGTIGVASLTVSKSSGSTVMKGVFVLPDDSTEYAIISVAGAGPVYVWTLDKPLAKTATVNNLVSILWILPAGDQELIVPYTDVPGPNADRANDPPPNASWGAVYQNRLFLVDAADPTRLVYSRIGHYEDFPPDNVFRFVQADYDPITAVLAGRQVGYVSEGADQRLVVGKERTSAQITGTDNTNFQLQPLFSETGIRHKRTAIVIAGFLVVLSRRGLELLEDQRPIFIGQVIKDIIDAIQFQDNIGPTFASDRRDNQLLFGVDLASADSVLQTVENNAIILMREPALDADGRFGSPFSKITALPGPFGVLHESGFGSALRILLGTENGDIHQIFTGGVNEAASLTTPVVAIAETQPLPQSDTTTRKIFRSVRFEGNNISNDTGWKIEFSVDEGITWTAIRRMWEETLIGCVGKQLVMRITHDRIVEGSEELPMISNYELLYTRIGGSR